MIAAVAVVIPARDEEERIAAAVRSVARAALTVTVPVATVVAVEGADRTAERAVAAGASVTRGAYGSPTRARSAGVAAARSLLDADPAHTWVATTDADCVVPPDWLAVQLVCAAAGADAVAGGIVVGDWSAQPAARATYEALLASRRRPGGRHTGAYGANLGVRLSALDAVGGWPAVEVGEDRALVAALVAARLVVARPEEPRVVTSARPDGRAVGGLSALLRGFAADAGQPSADVA